MGKAQTPKRAGAGASSPYARPGKTAGKGGSSNNIFKFNTNVGQHVLKNSSVAQAIVDKAELKPTDVVVEIGPGTGMLTTRILESARKVVAYELDPRMAAEVTKRVQGGPLQKKLEVVLGDAIKAEFPPAFDVCISNTPYQISSPLVFKLLALPNPPRTAVLMFQKEFAQRLVARPNDALYCRLSVNAQYFARISHVLKVGRANFTPPPQVESAVVRITPKRGSERPRFDFAEMDGMLRICFNRKNRTLRTSFGTKQVLAMVERNYRLFASMNNIPLEEGLAEAPEAGADEAEDDDMEVDADDGDDAEAADDGMDVEDDDAPAFFKEMAAAKAASGAPPKTPSRRKKSKVEALVKGKIDKALQATGLADRRARQCDENDFLRLLSAMNEQGIHFS